jgi:hypothetical protein
VHATRLARPGLGLPPGRTAAGAVVAAYFALLVALGGYGSWGRLGVPGFDSGLSFGDLRNVTTAWECVRRGISVLPVNPCDPQQRPANYPRLWLAPSFLGLGESSTVALGIVVAGVFVVAALAVVPPGASTKAGLLYGAAVCSPAVMLGVQRGNVDLLLFALLALAVIVSTRRARGWIAANVLVFIAAVLKLFPIFAAGFLLRRVRRGAPAAATVAVVAGFAIYALATLGTIRAIERAVPQSDVLSFGVRRVSEWLGAVTGAQSSLRAWDGIVVLAVAATVALGRRRLRIALRAGDGRELDLFWAGACVYVGCYALFRSFDYRLAFALMTVPQLTRWAGSRSLLALATLVGLFGALWLDTAWSGLPVIGAALHGWDRTTRTGGFAFPLAAISQLVLFAGLAAGLVGTAPVRAR